MAPIAMDRCFEFAWRAGGGLKAALRHASNAALLGLWRLRRLFPRASVRAENQRPRPHRPRSVGGGQLPRIEGRASRPQYQQRRALPQRSRPRRPKNHARWRSQHGSCTVTRPVRQANRSSPTQLPDRGSCQRGRLAPGQPPSRRRRSRDRLPADASSFRPRRVSG